MLLGMTGRFAPGAVVGGNAIVLFCIEWCKFWRAPEKNRQLLCKPLEQRCPARYISDFHSRRAYSIKKLANLKLEAVAFPGQ